MKIVLKASLFITMCLVMTLSIAKKSKTQWVIDSDGEWNQHIETKASLQIESGVASPTSKVATFKTKPKVFTKKTALSDVTFAASVAWDNWEPTPSKVVPPHLGDAPVALALGDNSYWLFGAHTSIEKMVKEREKRKKRFNGNDPVFAQYKLDNFEPKDTTLEGFDMPLKTTPYPHQFDAPGTEQPRSTGYHAWESKDMVNWIRHGAVAVNRAFLCTTAEYADGKLYIYYDYPNDQDPHLCIDDDLRDGIPGKDMGLVFKDPSDGSDCGIIRDLEGDFHLILEDWSPVDASTHAWDSPLAMHAKSTNGYEEFKILPPAVDERTTPTGKMGTYVHPHWTMMDRENFKSDTATYEIHTPEQDAFGDWATIAIGGQYYLFSDYDPAGGHKMSVGMFTSSSLDKQFSFIGSVGEDHPDPDILFAENQFYLVTQTNKDYVSPGPWVEKVEVKVGVATTKSGEIDYWTDWQEVKESYDYIEGFAKQISKIPARLSLPKLPKGYAFQLEVRLTDITKNDSKPMLESITFNFN